jgi:hypothetical protein
MNTSQMTTVLSRDFRKIDIEQYAEDFYEDEETNSGLTGPAMDEVQGFISGGKMAVSS